MTQNQATPEDYLQEEATSDLEKWKIETKFQPATGCWIDDRWGQYGVTRLIEIAKDYGFVTYDDDEAAIYAFKHGEDEFWFENSIHFATDWILMQGGLGDDAEDWLDVNVAQEGYMFGWIDGEFYYMHKSWWETASY